MKIKETIERDCCQPQDLRPYKGVGTAKAFCQHCGQLWGEASRMDAAGSRESILTKITPAEWLSRFNNPPVAPKGPTT